MNIIVINSSPKGDKGNTGKILMPFVEGMKKAGADIEIFYLKKLDIKPCLGEIDCQTQNPGTCFLKDDMQILLPKTKNAEILVLASPLYVYMFNTQMKAFIERMFPLSYSFGRVEDSDLKPKLREDIKLRKVVLVSTGAFWKLNNFDLLVEYTKFFCNELQLDFSGALLRPHAHAVQNENVHSKIFEALSEAGKQLIEQGKISKNTERIVSSPLLTFEEYLNIYNIKL